MQRDLGWRELLLVILIAVLWIAFLRAGPPSLPFFWDEADVYAPGAKWVAENGLDARPGIIPDDYSRGHPTLLYLLAGVAFFLFGTTPAVGHLVVIPFAILTLVGTYLLGRDLFGIRAGIAATALLGCTPMFLSVGNMLLPEIVLTGLTAICLWCYARGYWLAVVLLGTALVWTKETGVFTTLAITGAVLFAAYRSKRLDWRSLSYSLIPMIAFGIFALWQKINIGYYFFPHHEFLLWDRPLGFTDVATVWPSIWLWDGRFIVTFAALLFLIWQRSVPFRFATPEGSRPSSAAVAVAIILLFLANAVFFTKMFWLERYALPAHPGLLVLLAGVVTAAGSLRQQFLRWVPIAATFIWGLVVLSPSSPPANPEHCFAYADVIATHRAAFTRIQREPDPVVVTSWPMTTELREPYLGYVDRAIPAMHVDRPTVGLEPTLLLLAHGSAQGEKLRQHAIELGMHRIAEIQIGAGRPMELYSR